MRIYNNNNQTLKNAIAALESQINGYKTSFTQSNINPQGIFIAVHNLNISAASVNIFDETGEQINPREILITDSNTIAIDLSDYIPIPGAYNLLIHG